MPVFKKPSFSKIINNSNAIISLNYDKKSAEEVAYELIEPKKFQIFFLDGTLFIEGESTLNPVEIFINKKTISYIETKQSSFLKINHDIHIDEIHLKDKSQASINQAIISSLYSYDDSILYAKSIDNLNKLHTYNRSSVDINSVHSENLSIEHSSTSPMQINNGHIQSLIVEKKNGSEAVLIQATVDHIDLLNESTTDIYASYINKSLTVSLNNSGGIEVNGKCEEFIHIKNDGDNHVLVSDINSQRIHCINSKQSTTKFSGITDNLLYSSQELSFAYFNELICSAADISMCDTKMDLTVEQSVVGNITHQSNLKLNAPELFHCNVSSDDSSLLHINEKSHENQFSNIIAKENINNKIVDMRENFKLINQKNKLLFK